MRNNKGITVISLVITVIIMLILSTVSINFIIKDNGIINNAKKSKTEQIYAKIEEQKEMWFAESTVNFYSENIEEKSLESFLNELVQQNLITNEEKSEILLSNNGTFYIGDKKIGFKRISEEIKNGNIEIGDVINYKAENGKQYISEQSKNGVRNQIFQVNSEIEWRIWGIDEETGGVMIVPSLPVIPINEDGYHICGFEGYNNGIDELNKIAQIYGTGKGAINARSLNIYDIDKIMGITEEFKYVKNPDYNSEIIATNGTWYDGTTITTSNPRKAIEKYYWYSYDEEWAVTKNNTKLYELIFINNNEVYLLANQTMWKNRDFNFSLFNIGWGDFDVAYMIDTKLVKYPNYIYGVRPVVILDPNITLTDLE